MRKHPGRRVRRRKLRTLSAAERMRRMRERRRAQGLKEVVNWVPRKRPVQTPALDQRLLEARSLALHVMAAIKIDGDPELLEVARAKLARWREPRSERAGAWIRAWSAILNQPWPSIAARMTEQSERGVALRQATPFVDVLSARERRKIYEAFRVVQRRLNPAPGELKSALPEAGD